MTFDGLINACKKKNIQCVAVADHGTIKGASELSKIAPFKVIICEEIMTPYGEIMGMFLQETIPNKISVEQTINAIRSQGGLVCIPHPYDRIRPSAFRDTKMLESIMNDVDIIEVFNSRSMFPGIEKKAKILAHKYDKLMSVGTDSHSSLEIGYAYVEINDFHSKEEFLSVLANARLYGKKSSPFIHLISTTARLKKRGVSG
jgi:predicted metal-dependent phosphoesterase TrpH